MFVYRSLSARLRQRSACSLSGPVCARKSANESREKSRKRVARRVCASQRSRNDWARNKQNVARIKTRKRSDANSEEDRNDAKGAVGVRRRPTRNRGLLPRRRQRRDERGRRRSELVAKKGAVINSNGRICMQHSAILLFISHVERQF